VDGSRGYPLHEGLQAIWRCVARGNEYVDRQAPWKLAKAADGAAQLDETLGALVRQLARFSVLLFPYMPGKSRELWRQLGAPGPLEQQRFNALMELDGAGWRVAKGEGLFPRFEGRGDRGEGRAKP
jgi:methionyl-tRNA synthetase